VIRLYGRNLAIAERELARFTGLRASVEIGGELSYRESLLAQRRATVLILLEWPDPQASGVLTGKIFEYLSSGRPIIATGPRGGEIDQVLRQTGRGRLAATVEELEALLLDAYKRYLTQGPEPTRSDLTALEPFTRRAMTGHLADVFNAVAGNESC
jgi:hypothetical protein